MNLSVKSIILLHLLILLFSVGASAQCEPLTSNEDRFTGSYSEYWASRILDQNLVNDNDFRISFGVFIYAEGSDTVALLLLSHLLERTNEDIQTVGPYEIREGDKLYFELSNGEILELTAVDRSQKTTSLLRGAVRYEDTGYYHPGESKGIIDVITALATYEVVSFRLALSPNRKTEEKVKKKYAKALQKQMTCLSETYYKE